MADNDFVENAKQGHQIAEEAMEKVQGAV